MNSESRAKGLFPVGHDQKVAGQLPSLIQGPSQLPTVRGREKFPFKFHHRHGSTKEVTLSLLDTVAAVRTFDGFDDKLRRKVMASNAQEILPRFAQLQ